MVSLITLIIFLWINAFTVLAITNKASLNAPETDVNDLVYFNQVFDMVIKQSTQTPDKLTQIDNSTIPLVTIEKPKGNDTSSVNAQTKIGKLQPKWEFGAGIYLEKKVNKKLINKMANNQDKFRKLSGGDNGFVFGTTEKILIPTDLVVSRAMPDTHNLFVQNSTTYPKLQTKITLQNIKKPDVSTPESAISTYLYYDDYSDSLSDNYSSGSRLVHSFWNYPWWILLYIL